NLEGADLRGANLSGANLKSVKINQATKLDYKWRLVWEILNHKNKHTDLRNADFEDANLQGADLRNTDLSNVKFTRAKVDNALFGYNQGLSLEMKLELKLRGAVFEDE
ncbi:pentapeptide repeat-containing protein, partial [Fischerella thermalis]